MGKSKDLASGAAYQDQTESDTRYVNTAGDTMTGNLQSTELVANNAGNNTNIRVQNTASGSGSSDGFVIQNATNSKVYLWNYENSDVLFGTNSIERMKIDGSGRVTKPNQPAFEAYVATGSSAVLPTGIHKFSSSSAFNSHVFTNINFNIGSHYNSSNSRFTAPAAGRYLIYGGVATSSASSSAYMSYEFYISGTRKADGWNAKPGGYHKESSWRIFNLAANDYVEPGYENGSAMQVLSQGSTNNNYIYFGGYFLG